MYSNIALKFTKSQETYQTYIFVQTSTMRNDNSAKKIPSQLQNMYAEQNTNVLKGFILYALQCRLKKKALSRKLIVNPSSSQMGIQLTLGASLADAQTLNDSPSRPS